MRLMQHQLDTTVDDETELNEQLARLRTNIRIEEPKLRDTQLAYKETEKTLNIALTRASTLKIDVEESLNHKRQLAGAVPTSEREGQKLNALFQKKKLEWDASADHWARRKPRPCRRNRTCDCRGVGTHPFLDDSIARKSTPLVRAILYVISGVSAPETPRSQLLLGIAWALSLFRKARS